MADEGSLPTGGPNADGWADATVHAQDLEVIYRVYSDRRPPLRDLFAGRSRAREYREIHAVRGITFTAQAGEAIGLIGRNGSGKSTLLRTISGLLPPAAGAAFARSQPVLLGVGAALQSNLSGRRNIELGLLALGLEREEVRRRTGEVASFADLEEFIDLPIRTYSSGMRARLHFAIATEVHPDILLIDEALAVGDAVFKKRSEERINELLDSAGTVFLVSHSMPAILDICTRVLWVEKGTLMEDGDAASVVRSYQEFSDRKGSR